MQSMETIVTSSCLLLPASACTGTVFQFAAPNSFTNAELVLVACCLFFFPLRTGVRDLVSVSVCLCLDSLSIYLSSIASASLKICCCYSLRLLFFSLLFRRLCFFVCLCVCSSSAIFLSYDRACCCCYLCS